MSIRTPLAKAKGLGSARNGTGHFIIQRLTAILLIPLVLYFPFAISSLVKAQTYSDVLLWFDNPLHSGLVLAFMAAAFYHGALGLQVIIEDYVHNEKAKLASLIGMKIVLFIAAIVAFISIIKLALA